MVTRQSGANAGTDTAGGKTARFTLAKRKRTDPSKSPIRVMQSGQLFIRTNNVTLSVAAMCVCNPDRSPLRING